MRSRLATCPCWHAAEATSHERAAVAAISFLLSMRGTDAPDEAMLDELADSIAEIRPWRQA